jgi:hypothetical protein
VNLSVGCTQQIHFCDRFKRKAKELLDSPLSPRGKQREAYIALQKEWDHFHDFILEPWADSRTFKGIVLGSKSIVFTYD